MPPSPLHYEVHEGPGPFLLLVHGMLSSRAQWSPNLAALGRVSRPVVVELLGHGRSPSPEEPRAYTPSGYVEAFEEIRAELGVETWIVCGQSLGAALTLRYALDLPDRIRAQIFTNSNSALAEGGWEGAVRPFMEEQARRLEAEGRGALERLAIHPRRSRSLPREIRDALVADCALHDPRGIALTGLHTVPGSSVRKRIHQNRVPSLLVVGDREKRFAPQAAFAKKTMPHLEVVRTEAGHAVNLEAPEVFDAVVTSFVRRHAAARL